MGLSKYSFQHTRGVNLQEKGDRNWQKDFIPLIADKLYVTKLSRSFLLYNWYNLFCFRRIFLLIVYSLVISVVCGFNNNVYHAVVSFCKDVQLQLLSHC